MIHALSDSSSHSYTVKAWNVCGTSGSSGSASGYANATPPAPTGVSASDGTYCGYVHITWNATPLAAAYYVYRDGSYASAASGPSYDDYVGDISTHSYTVQAYNKCGTSGTSGSASGYARQTPTAPTGVGASLGGNCGFVYVTWNSVSGATGYYVYRDGSQVGSTPGTSYNDNLSDTSSHSYTVRAYNGCGTGATSGSASGYANAAPPAPTSVAASTGAYCGYVHVTWDSTPRATSYSVYRDGGYIGSTGATGYDDYLGDTTSHTYSVQASNSCGTGPVSGGSAGYVNAAPPTPTGVVASTGTYCGYVHVTWDSVPRATVYLVYRDAGYVGLTGATGYDDYPGDTTSHTYSVQASNGCGTSPPSSAASGYVSTVFVSTGASPLNGGSTSGGGSYACGQSVTVTATPNSGYTFANWTLNGTVVSTSASYIFTASANVTLVANFTANTVSLGLTGVSFSNGVFCCSYYGQVGSNYEFQASTDLKHWTVICDFTCTNSPMTLAACRS